VPTRKIIQRFETEKAARKWADAVAYARKCNALPVLVVEAQGDGSWAVVNPDVDAKAQPYKRPREAVPE